MLPSYTLVTVPVRKGVKFFLPIVSVALLDLSPLPFAELPSLAVIVKPETAGTFVIDVVAIVSVTDVEVPGASVNVEGEKLGVTSPGKPETIIVTGILPAGLL